MIEVAASVTGMFKQDYYISKLLDRTVVVQGSCKIHRALYDRLTETLEELKRIEAGSGVIRTCWRSFRRLLKSWTICT